MLHTKILKADSLNQPKSNEHILEVYVHIPVKDEVSMPTHMDRRAYERKLPNWLPYKNYKSESLNFDVHTYTKYEVSMSNNVPGGGVHR